MFRNKCPFILVALLALAGCQLTDTYELYESCPDLEAIQEQDKVICTRDTRENCYNNHDKTQNSIKQADFAAAFDSNRCPSGYECNPDAHTCSLKLSECNKGDSKCVDETIHECQKGADNKFNWVPTDKKCTAVCTNGDTKCSESMIYTCENGQWKTEPTLECEFGCAEGVIQNVSQALECYDCDEDSYVCEGNKLISCTDHVLGEDDCEYGCFTKDEVGDCGVCLPGSRECDDSYYLSICSETGEWEQTECPSGCQDGVCNVCDPGLQQCDDTDPNKLLSCQQDGTWSEKICEFGCRHNECSECAPGTKTCDASDWKTLKSCTASGRWESIQCDLGCTSGHCNDCSNGAKKCASDTQIQICVDGYWDMPTLCEDQKTCVPVGTSYDCRIQKQCTASNTGTYQCGSCMGNKVCSQRCDYTGAWYNDGVCNNGCNDSTGKCY